MGTANDNAEKFLGGCLVVGILVIAGGFLITSFREKNKEHEANGRAAALQATLGEYAEGLRLDTEALPTNGTVPLQPKLVFVSIDLKLATPNDKLDTKNARYRLHPLDQQLSETLIAKSADEINVVVIRINLESEAFKYDNGTSATRHDCEVVVVNSQSQVVVSRRRFSGTSPDSKVVAGGHPLGRSGTTSGAPPSEAEVAGWVVQVLTPRS